MAVFTEVTLAEAQALTKTYPHIGTLKSLEGIAEGTENTNYRLKTEGGLAILTLFEGRVDHSKLGWYIELQTHIRAAGIPAPKTFINANGKSIQKVKNIPAAIFEHLGGMATAEPTPKQCTAAGQALAHLHLAAKDFTPQHKNPMDISTLRQMQGTIMADVPELPGPMMTLFESLVDSTVDVSKGLLELPENLPHGVGHLDYFPDNVFFERDNVSGIIDYFFAGDDYWAYDLAIALIAWGFDSRTGSLRPERFAAFTQGYTQVRPLEEAEQAAMPLFLTLAAARFLTTRLYDAVLPRKRGTGQAHNPLTMYRRLVYVRGQANWQDYPIS